MRISTHNVSVNYFTDNILKLASFLNDKSDVSFQL